MKKRWLILLGVAAFLVTLALHAPGSYVYAWVLKARAGEANQLHGIHGTLSHGGFASLSVNGRPVLHDASWDLHPLWLALLRVTADVETEGDPVVRMRVSRSLFGPLRLSRVNAEGGVKPLLALLGQPWPIEGQARLDLPLLRLDQGLPVEAIGSVEVEDLAWTLAREPLALGSFNAALTTDDKGVLASFGSGPGPLEVGGSAVLKPDRSYQLDLQLRPRAGAPEPLLALVRSLGAADGQGWHHLRRQGTLP